MKKVITPLFKTNPLFYQPLPSYWENLFTIHQYTFRNLYIWETMLTGRKAQNNERNRCYYKINQNSSLYSLIKIYKSFLQPHLDYGSWMGKPGCHLALAMSAMSSDTEGHCAAATALTALDASTLLVFFLDLRKSQLSLS